MFSFAIAGQCSRHDYGRRAGVCHPAVDHRQTTVRPSCQNHWTERNLVLWSAVRRQQGIHHMAKIKQKG